MVSAVYVSTEQLKAGCMFWNGYEKHLNAFTDENRGVFSHETLEGGAWLEKMCFMPQLVSVTSTKRWPAFHFPNLTS